MSTVKVPSRYWNQTGAAWACPFAETVASTAVRGAAKKSALLTDSMPTPRCSREDCP